VSATICIAADTYGFPTGGGYMWIYLNWALGFRSAGCDVMWLEQIHPGADVPRLTASLEDRLRPYGLADSIVLVNADGTSAAHPAARHHVGLDDAAGEADLLFTMKYGLSARVVARFRRTAMIDIDPGLTQIWLSKGWIDVPPHDIYLTIGETVGQPDALFPDAGIDWQYVPTGACLDVWHACETEPSRPFTTVSSWGTWDEWIEDGPELYSNDKRDGFLPYLDLPARTSQPLELALALDHEEGPPAELTERGWGVVDSNQIVSTPWSYMEYVRSSRGEFSCVKPSCVRLQNAWISDRTVCYLASGRPAVIEDTGPSRVLPDAEGLLRFRTPDEAAAQLEAVASDYERQCVLARQLAEEHFDSRKNAARALELALAVPARR
jgi:hypothetical protein